MTNQHRWLLALIAWILFLPCIGSIHEAYSLPAPIFGLVVLVVMLPLFCSVIRRTTHLWYAASVLAAVTAINMLDVFGNGEGNPVSPLTEAGILVFTAILSLEFARSSQDLENISAELTRLSLPHRYPDLKTAESEMERELRRARRYERPLSLVTIQPPEFHQIVSPIIVESVREHLTRQYALGRIAEILHNETKMTDIVSFADGRFVLLLPETKREEAIRLSNRLTQRVREVLSAELTTGMASFPSEEITLFGLMERAQTPAGASPESDRDDYQVRKLTPVEEPEAELV